MTIVSAVVLYLWLFYRAGREILKRRNIMSKLKRLIAALIAATLMVSCFSMYSFGADSGTSTNIGTTTEDSDVAVIINNDGSKTFHSGIDNNGENLMVTQVLNYNGNSYLRYGPDTSKGAADEWGNLVVDYGATNKQLNTHSGVTYAQWNGEGHYENYVFELDLTVDKKANTGNTIFQIRGLSASGGGSWDTDHIWLSESGEFHFASDPDNVFYKITPGTWTHLQFIYNRTANTLYITADGVLVVEKAGFMNLNTQDTSAGSKSTVGKWQINFERGKKDAESGLLMDNVQFYLNKDSGPSAYAYDASKKPEAIPVKASGVTIGADIDMSDASDSAMSNFQNSSSYTGKVNVKELFNGDKYLVLSDFGTNLTAPVLYNVKYQNGTAARGSGYYFIEFDINTESTLANVVVETVVGYNTSDDTAGDIADVIAKIVDGKLYIGDSETEVHTFSFDEGAWSHVAIVINMTDYVTTGEKIEAYVNGAKVGESEAGVLVDGEGYLKQFTTFSVGLASGAQPERATLCLDNLKFATANTLGTAMSDYTLPVAIGYSDETILGFVNSFNEAYDFIFDTAKSAADRYAKAQEIIALRAELTDEQFELTALEDKYNELVAKDALLAQDKDRPAVAKEDVVNMVEFGHLSGGWGNNVPQVSITNETQWDGNEYKLLNVVTSGSTSTNPNYNLYSGGGGSANQNFKGDFVMEFDVATTSAMPRLMFGSHFTYSGGSGWGPDFLTLDGNQVFIGGAGYGNIEPNRWYHIAVSVQFIGEVGAYTGTVVNLYINNELVGSVDNGFWNANVPAYQYLNRVQPNIKRGTVVNAGDNIAFDNFRLYNSSNPISAYDLPADLDSYDKEAAAQEIRDQIDAAAAIINGDGDVNAKIAAWNSIKNLADDVDFPADYTDKYNELKAVVVSAVTDEFNAQYVIATGEGTANEKYAALQSALALSNNELFPDDLSAKADELTALREEYRVRAEFETNAAIIEDTDAAILDRIAAGDAIKALHEDPAFPEDLEEKYAALIAIVDNLVSAEDIQNFTNQFDGYLETLQDTSLTYILRVEAYEAILKLVEDNADAYVVSGYEGNMVIAGRLYDNIADHLSRLDVYKEDVSVLKEHNFSSLGDLSVNNSNLPGFKHEVGTSANGENYYKWSFDTTEPTITLTKNPGFNISTSNKESYATSGSYYALDIDLMTTTTFFDKSYITLRSDASGSGKWTDLLSFSGLDIYDVRTPGEDSIPIFTATPGEWFHLSVVFDFSEYASSTKTVIKIYINGELVSAINNRMAANALTSFGYVQICMNSKTEMSADSNLYMANALVYAPSVPYPITDYVMASALDYDAVAFDAEFNSVIAAINGEGTVAEKYQSVVRLEQLMTMDAYAAKPEYAEAVTAAQATIDQIKADYLAEEFKQAANDLKAFVEAGDYLLSQGIADKIDQMLADNPAAFEALDEWKVYTEAMTGLPELYAAYQLGVINGMDVSSVKYGLAMDLYNYVNENGLTQYADELNDIIAECVLYIYGITWGLEDKVDFSEYDKGILYSRPYNKGDSPTSGDVITQLVDHNSPNIWDLVSEGDRDFIKVTFPEEGAQQMYIGNTSNPLPNNFVVSFEYANFGPTYAGNMNLQLRYTNASGGGSFPNIFTVRGSDLYYSVLNAQGMLYTEVIKDVIALDTWYKFDVVIDIAKRTASIYVNGIALTDNVRFYGDDAKFTATQIARIDFRSNENFGCSVGVDNYYIYEGTAPRNTTGTKDEGIAKFHTDRYQRLVNTLALLNVAALGDALNMISEYAAANAEYIDETVIENSQSSIASAQEAYNNYLITANTEELQNYIDGMGNYEELEPNELRDHIAKLDEIVAKGVDEQSEAYTRYQAIKDYYIANAGGENSQAFIDKMNELNTEASYDERMQFVAEAQDIIAAGYDEAYEGMAEALAKLDAEIKALEAIKNTADAYIAAVDAIDASAGYAAVKAAYDAVIATYTDVDKTYAGVTDADSALAEILAYLTGVEEDAADYIDAADALESNTTYATLKDAIDAAKALYNSDVAAVAGVSDAKALVDAAEAKLAAIVADSEEFIRQMNSYKDTFGYSVSKSIVDSVADIVAALDTTYPGVTDAKAIYDAIQLKLAAIAETCEEFLAAADVLENAKTYAEKLAAIQTIEGLVESVDTTYSSDIQAKVRLYNSMKSEVERAKTTGDAFVAAVNAASSATGEAKFNAITAALAAFDSVTDTTYGSVNASKTSLDALVTAYNSSVDTVNAEVKALNKNAADITARTASVVIVATIAAVIKKIFD